MIAELLNSTVPPAPARAGGGGPLRRPSGGGVEPVQWLDYQVQVTDEAGAIVSELALTEVVDQIASERAGAEAEADVSPRGQLLDESSEPLEQIIPPETAGVSGRKDLDAIMSSLALELQEVTQAQGDLVPRVGIGVSAIYALGDGRWRPGMSGSDGARGAIFGRCSAWSRTIGGRKASAIRLRSFDDRAGGDVGRAVGSTGIVRWGRKLSREALAELGILRGRVPAPSVWSELFRGAGCGRAGTAPRGLGEGRGRSRTCGD